MRIYNAKNSQVDLPLSGNVRVTISAHSVSKDIMPSDEFLTMVAQTFEASELALIVAGPYEINMCAKNPACSELVVQSLDEAIERFSEEKEVAPAPVVEEKAAVEEEPIQPQEEVKEEEPVIAPVVEEEAVEEEPVAAPAKKKSKKNKKK